MQPCSSVWLSYGNLLALVSNSCRNGLFWFEVAFWLDPMAAIHE